MNRNQYFKRLNRTKDPDRVIAGYKAQSRGSSFEKQFMVQCNLHKVAYIHLPQMGASYKTNQFHQKKQICCDFIIGKNNRTILIDTKSIHDRNQIRYTVLNEKSFRYQIRTLADYQNRSQSQMDFKRMAGFVVYFHKANTIRFFYPQQLFDVVPGSSIHFEKGFELGNYQSFDPTLIF